MTQCDTLTQCTALSRPRTKITLLRNLLDLVPCIPSSQLQAEEDQETDREAAETFIAQEASKESSCFKALSNNSIEIEVEQRACFAKDSCL
jgi:hypothetical protein